MDNIECAKCGCTDLFTSATGNNTGVYCSRCKSWIKWISKKDLKFIEALEVKNNKISSSAAVPKKTFNVITKFHALLPIAKKITCKNMSVLEVKAYESGIDDFVSILEAILENEDEIT